MANNDVKIIEKIKTFEYTEYILRRIVIKKEDKKNWRLWVEYLPEREDMGALTTPLERGLPNEKTAIKVAQMYANYYNLTIEYAQ